MRFSTLRTVSFALLLAASLVAQADTKGLDIKVFPVAKAAPDVAVLMPGQVANLAVATPGGGMPLCVLLIPYENPRLVIDPLVEPFLLVPFAKSNADGEYRERYLIHDLLSGWHFGLEAFAMDLGTGDVFQSRILHVYVR